MSRWEGSTGKALATWEWTRKPAKVQTTGLHTPEGPAWMLSDRRHLRSLTRDSSCVQKRWKAESGGEGCGDQQMEQKTELREAEKKKMRYGTGLWENWVLTQLLHSARNLMPRQWRKGLWRKLCWVICSRRFCGSCASMFPWMPDELLRVL